MLGMDHFILRGGGGGGGGGGGVALYNDSHYYMKHQKKYLFPRNYHLSNLNDLWWKLNNSK